MKNNTLTRSAAIRPRLDPVEKVMLGAAPADPDPDAGRPSALQQDPVTTRLEVVRTFLARQPELHAALKQEVDTAWRGAGGDRMAFLGAIAERRAQIVSAATIASEAQRPGAAADFHDELTRYLTLLEGFSE
jgi:hypothetical protein